MLVIWLTARRQAKRSASLRLEAGSEEVVRSRPAPVPVVGGRVRGCGSAALAAAGAIGPQGAFFLAGFAVAAGGLGGYRWCCGGRRGRGGGDRGGWRR